MQDPGFANLDLSFLQSFALAEKKTLQFRAEYFNTADHATFTVPVSDLNSGNFGKVLEAGPSRLFRLALKVVHYEEQTEFGEFEATVGASLYWWFQTAISDFLTGPTT